MLLGKKKIIISLILFACFCNCVEAKIRDAGFDAIKIRDDAGGSKLVSSQKSGRENFKIESIIGKSQLIKFDEPLKRVSIANPEIADIVFISDKEIIINGKKAGITNLIVWNTKDSKPVFFDLTVKQNLHAFKQALNDVIPDENVNFDLSDNSNNLVLTGRVSSTIKKDRIKDLAKAYGFNLVDMSECPSPQVMLSVNVVEASRTFSKNMKVNYVVGENINDLKFGVLKNLAKKGTGSVFDGTLNGSNFYSYSPNNDFGAILNFAEEKGLIRILAEPKLVAINGEEASFNAGQQVPVPAKMGQDGNIAYEFKETGVKLNFTPTIQEDSQRIKLKIAPEVSEIDSSTSITRNDGVVIYGFKTRKAQTTVDLRSGETLVIAGLLKRSTNEIKGQVPILSSIPLAGNFFKSIADRNDETELMIFVTPKIIGEMYEDEL